VPDGLVRVLAPVAGLMGQPNLGELVDASVGVTYLGSSARAEEELGFTARDVETGLREVYGETAASAAAG
jgi:hypothetical protein